MSKNKSVRELRIDIVHSEVEISKMLQKIINEYGYLQFSISCESHFMKTDSGESIPVTMTNVKIEATLI